MTTEAAGHFPKRHEYLARAEEKQAKERGLAWFKFSDDESMLTAIEQEKSRAVSVVVGS